MKSELEDSLAKEEFKKKLERKRIQNDLTMVALQEKKEKAIIRARSASYRKLRSYQMDGVYSLSWKLA